MTEPLDENSEERLRAILRSEVDGVRTSGDALDRIRARTSTHRLAWLDNLLGMWLRPAVAVAVTVLLATSVMLSMPQLRGGLLTAGDQEPSPRSTPEATQETAAGEVTPPEPPTEEPERTPQDDTASPTAPVPQGNDLPEEQLRAAAEACSVEPSELLAASEGAEVAELTADEAEECLNESETPAPGEDDSSPTSPPPDAPSPTESPADEEPDPEPSPDPNDAE
ncbi:hypothetical protein RIF23_12840 [Lipingzhangella sp. LS1_29]|uniref:Uncharacterized protein n=1 Tax=Lipingzhangella rawalii TaxID=2055835 RepID=A0ABU2H793_9ACTN|nr:hypothetical protein [Lipingzhangella rawalii]MDS1271182.1 hypothetical protein [Lipingzhangella rawalii]